jgi:hypothetical protein
MEKHRRNFEWRAFLPQGVSKAAGKSWSNGRAMSNLHRNPWITSRKQLHLRPLNANSVMHYCTTAPATLV